MKNLIQLATCVVLITACNGTGFQVKTTEVPPTETPAPEEDNGILDIGEEYAGGIYAGGPADESYKLIVTPGNCTDEVTPTCDGNDDSIDFDRWNGWLYCDNLVYGGYADWHVPEFEHANYLYLNRVAIGGFKDVFYWTNWQDNLGVWHVVDFSNGSDLIIPDTELHSLRCVREEYPAPPPI